MKLLFVFVVFILVGCSQYVTTKGGKYKVLKMPKDVVIDSLKYKSGDTVINGVLYFTSKNSITYWIKPEEEDLIIMPADMPHSPNNAPNSTLDRIVMAGNVGFELIKNFKSII